MNRNDDIFLDVEYIRNLDFFGSEIDKNARQFQCENFSTFLEKRSKKPTPPVKPKHPKPPREKKHAEKIYNAVYKELKSQYYELNELHKCNFEHYEKRNQYTANLSGYAEYLTAISPTIATFSNGRSKIPISELERQRHTYITGGVGSGKSETIKSFIWHYLTRNKGTGLILLTPHGEVATQVARFHLNLDNDRLVYINPAIDGRHFPCINPFDVPNKSSLDDNELEIYAKGFIETFEEILGAEFSTQMETLLKCTLPVIIRLPNSSIYDLIDFLKPIDKQEPSERVIELLEYSKKHIKNKMINDFLGGFFLDEKGGYNTTKRSVHSRLFALFSNTVTQKFFVGKTTVNLRDLMDKRKLIIFDFSKGDLPTSWDTLGKFSLIAVKLAYLSREPILRAGKKPVPCHFFIDECQAFITDSIMETLNESRKYGVFLTLAQQQAGINMSHELFQSVMGNIAVKLTGRNGDIKTLKAMAESTQADIEILQNNLGTGRFMLSRENVIPGQPKKENLVVTMPVNTLDDKQSMTPEQWEAVKFDQIRQYYRVPKPNQAKDKVNALEGEKSPVMDEIDPRYFN